MFPCYKGGSATQSPLPPCRGGSERTTSISSVLQSESLTPVPSYSLLPSSYCCLSHSSSLFPLNLSSIFSLSLSSCLLDSPHLPLSTSPLCFHWPQLSRHSKPSRLGPSSLDSEVNLLQFWFHFLPCSMRACVRCALHWPVLQLRLEVTPKLG